MVKLQSLSKSKSTYCTIYCTTTALPKNSQQTFFGLSLIFFRRCMEVLGFDEYIESFTDGLQVLRYNQTTAYIPHMDWIDDPHKKEMHNYDSAGQGTNRFATILLYMSDLGEGDGGETVFKHAWPLDVPEDQRKSRAQALEELRSSGDASELQKDSWQELMVADCRSRLAVRPQSARAVLFYSQHPNGEEDTSSLHGGCPVLHGQKWAANLWVWNGPRGGFPGAPMNPGKERKEDDNNYEQIHVTFVNTGKDPLFKEAKLYFQDSFWGDFSHGDPPLSVNTYVGHQWNIGRISDNTLLKQIVIPSDKKSYKFEV
jgi:2OG-Fe(II) oxygenase superfamily.